MKIVLILIIISVGLRLLIALLGFGQAIRFHLDVWSNARGARKRIKNRT